MCDLEEKVHFSDGSWLDIEGSEGGTKLCCKIQGIRKPWAVPSRPSFALFPVNGVNNAASVQRLWGEDNAQREKSVQYCFIFMPHPDRKISFILCNTFAILVWINERLWENADTSCQGKTIYNRPSLLSWGIFIIIFSASQRDEQHSCSECKAEIEWAALSGLHFLRSTGCVWRYGWLLWLIFSGTGSTIFLTPYWMSLY